VAAGMSIVRNEQKPGSMSENGLSVSVCDVSIRVGRSQALDQVSFDCSRGEWVLIAGPSGAGKSTLLRTVNGLQAPTTGRVWTLGSWIPGRSRREARRVWRRTGTVQQEVALFETRSARANVELALRVAARDRASARHEALEWLERFNIADKAEDYPWRLSGGERQRVALARAMAPRPQLLILDEPTSALDLDTAQVVLEAIRELVGHNTTVLMSSHREVEVVEMCDRRIHLRKGRLVDGETRAPSDLERRSAVPSSRSVASGRSSGG
jgi:ABC-type multidrug transport system ATPase subunit